MADIEIVQPIEGAPRVDFDYTAAGDALDALSALSRKLGEQAEARATAKDEVIVNWQGWFRDEFDRAWLLLDLRFQAAIEAGAWGSLGIHQAVWDANAEQRRLNRAAEEAAEAGAGARDGRT
jgi:hypothetical protein